MGTKEKRIEQMRNNPRDHTMKDVEWLLCQQMSCEKIDGKGSHARFRHPTTRLAAFLDGVTIPHNRPIKPRYIVNALAYYDALVEKEEDTE